MVIMAGAALGAALPEVAELDSGDVGADDFDGGAAFELSLEDPQPDIPISAAVVTATSRRLLGFMSLTPFESSSYLVRTCLSLMRWANATVLPT
jgi:hypothetical protein